MLSVIETVELREIWKHEAIDFTNWLALPDNMQLLSQEIGLDMELVETEANVGSFSADILAVESNTGKKIIIENQLETTNHDHLGKIITYASGLEANYIVWIFKEIREEHRRAIDWLNEITDVGLSIFAIKMELWKIGDSKPAPKFNVICSPNDWSKAVRRSSGNSNMSEINLMQLEFWTGFNDYLDSNKTVFKKVKPRGQHWYDVSIGSSKAHISFVISIKEGFVRSEIYFPKDESLYNQLKSRKTEIERATGLLLDWQDLPHALASRIAIVKQLDVKSTSNHIIAYKWFIETGEKLKGAFHNTIKIANN